MRSGTGAANGEARVARELLVEIDSRRGRLRRSLGEALRVAVQDGRLGAGTRLPSSRTLASELGVSRGVVTDVYDQLAAEGYLHVEPRAAPLVAAVASAPAAAVEPEAPSYRYDLIPTLPDLGLFPRIPWARAMDRVLRDAPNAAFDYSDLRGQRALREVLASYLARVRGVRVEPGRIVVTQGWAQALDLLCRALARRGRTTMALETPSIPNGWATIRLSGLQIVSCGVDSEGVRAEELKGTAPDAVIVTPAHQFPTGAVLSPRRRSAIVEWAKRTHALIIEDDYDAEFRYDRMPVGSIQGLDPAHVVHVGTTSKTLAPGLRLAWMSLPPELVDEVREVKRSTDSGSPSLDQLALATLIASGDYERHVAQLRQIYRRRRDRLVAALRSTLPRLPVQGIAAGIHLLLVLPSSADDVAIERAARERGIRVRALSPLHLDDNPMRGLLLGYGRLGEEQVSHAVTALSEVLRPMGAAAL